MILLAVFYLAGLVGSTHHLATAHHAPGEHLAEQAPLLPHGHFHAGHDHHHVAPLLAADHHDHCCHELHAHEHPTVTLVQQIQPPKTVTRIGTVAETVHTTPRKPVSLVEGDETLTVRGGITTVASGRAPPTVFHA